MRLRHATPADVPAIREIYAPVVLHTTISFEVVVPSVEELTARLAATVPAYPWLVAVDDDGVVIGYAYGHQFSGRAAYAWAAETSIYVRDPARGTGVGRVLYSALLALLTAQGYRQAFAGIGLPNPGSVRLHEALGYRRIGTYHDVGFKSGRWHDVGWWQRPLAGGADPPAAPIPVDRLDPRVVEQILGGSGPP